MFEKVYALRARRTISLLSMTIIMAVAAACTHDPNIVKQKYLESGEKYFQRQKYNSAAIEFQNALKIDPKFAQAYFNLAKCDEKLGLWSRAYNELQRAVEFQPANWEAQIEIGNLLLAAKQYDRVEEKAKLVLADNPNNVQAHILLADVDAAAGRIEDSLREMYKAIALDPARADSYLNLGLIQMQAKQFSAAEQSYKKAVLLNPGSTLAILTLGEFYANQKRYAEAEQQVLRAVRMDASSPQPRITLSRLYLMEGQKDKAEQVLKDAKAALKDNPQGYRMLGEFYVSLGELDKAVVEYASLCKEHPQDLLVKKNYIQLLIQMSRLNEASSLTDEILKKSPNDVDALIDRGEILERQGKNDEAVQSLQAALRADPESALGHYYLGVAYGQSGGKVNLAEAEWRQAVRIFPALVDAQKDLAVLAMRKGEWDQLSVSAEELIKAQPYSPLGYVYRSVGEAARKDIHGAESDLQKAIEVAPKDPLPYTRFGELRVAQQQFSEAEKYFEEALRLDPNYGEALRGLAGIGLALKQPDKALARVNAQIAKAPNSSDDYFLLGQLLADRKDFQGAEAALEKTVQLNKNNVRAFLLLSQVEVARGSVEKAIASCDESIRQNPNDPRTFLLLGTLQEKSGDWQKAGESYKQALRIDPDYGVAANNLAYCMLEHGGNPDVALSYAQTARRIMPNDPNVADTLAWAYVQKGIYPTAIALLEAASKEVPDEVAFHYHLGMAYQKSNYKMKARQELEQVLKLDPGFPLAEEIRQLLAENGKS